MTTETVTEFEVSKEEFQKELVYCDNCGQQIEDDEPSTEVVAKPKVEKNSIELPRKLKEMKESVNNPRHHSNHLKTHADFSVMGASYCIEEMEDTIRKANRNATIEAITIHEDVCGSCFKQMTGEEIGEVPGVTVKELEGIDDFKEKAEEVASWPRKCAHVTLICSLGFLIAGLLMFFEGNLHTLSRIPTVSTLGFAALFLFFLGTTFHLYFWSDRIRHSYSP